MRDHLIEALDLQQPNWYVRLADPRDLEEYVDNTADRHFNPATNEAATKRLKILTAERLFIVLRAAVHSSLMIEVKSIQDALGTAEENEALVEVARNACRAEQELAALKLNLEQERSYA